jgi:Uma2 family endonuclease
MSTARSRSGPRGELDDSAWQFAIQLWFGQHSADWNILICPELLIQTSATHFRIADVAILDRAAPMSQITTHSPLAVFESLSPEDWVQRLTRKLEDYAGMGVREIWVIGLKAGTFSRFEDGQLLRRDRFQVTERGIDFPVSEIARLVEPR